VCVIGVYVGLSSCVLVDPTSRNASQTQCGRFRVCPTPLPVPSPYKAVPITVDLSAEFIRLS